MLLKGSTTVIAAPGDGPVLVNLDRDVAGWPPPGTGDVLVRAGRRAARAGPGVGEAAAAAAYLHGLAARLAAGGAGTRPGLARGGQAVVGGRGGPDRGG